MGDVDDSSTTRQPDDAEGLPHDPAAPADDEATPAEDEAIEDQDDIEEVPVAESVDATPSGRRLPPPPAGAEADPSGPVILTPLADDDGADSGDSGGAAAPRPRRRSHWLTAEPGRSRAIGGVAAGSVAVVALLAALLSGGNDIGGRGSADPPSGRSDPPPTGVADTADTADTAGRATEPADPPATDPAVTDPPATDPPATTAPPAPPTEPPATTAPPAPPAPPASTGAAEPGAPGVTTTTSPGPVSLVGGLVPDIAAFPESLDDIAQSTQIAALASSPRNDVASPGPIGSLCAVVRLETQAQLAGRWERNGKEVASTDLSTVGVPGFGDCLVGEGSAPLEEGVYQFVVADQDDDDSAAATFVLGAVALEQTFVNTSSEPICALRVGPSAAGFYEAYVFRPAPLDPGAAVIVTMADIDQDVQVDGCTADADPLAEFDFNPAAGVPQSLDPP